MFLQLTFPHLHFGNVSNGARWSKVVHGGGNGSCMVVVHSNDNCRRRWWHQRWRSAATVVKDSTRVRVEVPGLGLVRAREKDREDREATF